jgi:hypothetical protein
MDITNTIHLEDTTGRRIDLDARILGPSSCYQSLLDSCQSHCCSLGAVFPL